MNDSLQGQTCLVTGASRGIGAAIALALAEAGARIVVHYGASADKAKQVAGALPGENHIVVGADLADANNIKPFVDDVVTQTGRIDVLVNNAGIFEEHPPLSTGHDAWLAKWRHTIDVNLLAPAALCHAVAHVMLEQGGGRMINIGSRGAFRGEPQCPAYGASKAGLHAMSQSLAVALAPAGILVFAIAPGFVETDMANELLASELGDGIRAQSPLKRVARPDEIAEATRFLAATSAEFLTGAIVDINGASYLRT